jgi:hypothetical protein
MLYKATVLCIMQKQKQKTKNQYAQAHYKQTAKNQKIQKNLA